MIENMSGPTDPASALSLDSVLSRVSLVIPAYNEAATIEKVLSRTPEAIGEIIVVDGVSTDATAAIVRGMDSRIRVIERTRRGKGNALACGFAAASGEYVVAMDSDGSAAPEDIATLVAPLHGGFADFVKGHRVRPEEQHQGEFIRSLGGRALTGLFNAKFGQSFKDVCCGFVAFKRELGPAFGLEWEHVDDRMHRDDGFEIDVTLLGRALIANAAIIERPVRYFDRQGGESKIRLLPDGLRVLRAIETLD